MTDINFQPVFDYIDQNNLTLKEKIMTEVRSELFGIKTTLTNLVGEMKDFREEMHIANHRIT